MRWHDHACRLGTVVVNETPGANERSAALGECASYSHRARAAEWYFARFENLDAVCRRRRIHQCQLMRVFFEIAHSRIVNRGCGRSSLGRSSCSKHGSSELSAGYPLGKARRSPARVGAMSRSAVNRRAMVRAIWVTSLVLVVLYGGRVAWQMMMADEGDVPSSSSIPLPAGSTISSEEEACASGGCWIVVQVKPPAGQSPDDLATAMGATPQLRIPGNLFDPRTISVRAESNDQTLELRADYWSPGWEP